MTGADPLLEELAWLRALASTLADDSATADDVAQETVLVTLQSRGEVQKGLHAWLAGVATNTARNWIRKAARRRRTEARAAHRAVGEVSNTAADVHAALAAGVEQLAEPYRTAVVLRFYEGLPPRQIAKRLAEPVETVRTRIKRALSMLRQHLDVVFERREAWASVVQPKILDTAFRRPLLLLTKTAAVLALLYFLIPMLVFGWNPFALLVGEEEAPTASSIRPPK